MKAYDAAFYIAVFFIIGIAAASLRINIWLSLPIAAILIFSILKHRSVFWYTIVLFLFFMGYFYYNFYLVLHEEHIVFDKEITFAGIVIKEPAFGLKSQEIVLGFNKPYSGEVRIYTALYPEYHYGDLLEITGEVSKSSSNRSNIVSFPTIKLEGVNHGNRAKEFLFSIKQTLINNIERVLPREKSAFLAGILFGERGEFSPEFTEALKKSGTTHLVALSGYNVSIIAIALSNMFAYFGGRRRAFWFSIVFVVAFVLMTGAEESVVRAAIMGIVFLIAERSSRLYSFRNAVTLTAFVMLLLNPKLLIFNVGFQLSFMALIGLIYLKPALEKLLNIAKKETFLNWRENLLQTFSAQMAVLPVVIATFGYFSPLSLFSNVLILEFIPLTMFLGFVTMFLGVVSYHLSVIAGSITGILLGYEIFIINLFGVYLS